MSRPPVDVLIVGAGPAGLACACELSGLKILVLERESRHGGRVHTVKLAGQSVDMGACFAFDPALVPKALPISTGKVLEERAVLGICKNGAIHYGDTPLDCLTAMDLDSEIRAQIDQFARTDIDGATLRGSRAYTLLDSLLHQIHPGELAEYDVDHQRDGLYTWYPDHWQRGNQTLVDAMLTEGGADLLLNAEVFEITERAGRVEIGYRIGSDLRQVTCRAVVIATTADVAASLLKEDDFRCRRLLNSVRYGSYIVVALAGAASPALVQFRCLVPVDGLLAVVMQQRTFDRDSAVLLCYYCGSNFQALKAQRDEDLVALTRRELAALGIGKEVLNALRECSVKRWANAGTILSTEYRSSRDNAWSPGGDRIFLAGDYVSTSPGIGYGVADAVRSGIDTARRLRGVLNR